MNDNWAMLYAIELANKEKKPLVVVFNVVTKFLGAGARQFGFMLRGLREVESALEERGIPFKLLHGERAKRRLKSFAMKSRARGGDGLLSSAIRFEVARRFRKRNEAFGKSRGRAQHSAVLGGLSET